MLNAVFFPFSEMYINHVKSSEKYDMKIQHYHDAYEIYLQAVRDTCSLTIFVTR